MAMSDDTDERLDDLHIKAQSKEYLGAETQGPEHSERLAELRQLRSDLTTREEEFSERLGPDHHLLNRVQNEIETVENEIKELEEEQEAQEHLKEDLLEAFEQFELSEEWLDPTVLRALNHALHGTEQDAIIIDKTRIETVDDVSELTITKRLDLEEKLLRVIDDAQGKSSHTDEIWEWVQGEDRLELFAALAHEGSADKHRLSDLLGVEPKKAKNRAEYPIYKRGPDLIPFHSERGTFRLTTPAQYVARKYGPFDLPETDEQAAENAGDESAEEGEGEGTLSSFTDGKGEDEDVATDGGDASE